ncbi:MAG TPA: hypothetical protein VGO67_25705 [Verrucomicrobiae bacterium]|jgi:hypothetical protein
MKRLTLILFSLLLAAGGVKARAQETNSQPDMETNAAPAQDSNSFDLIIRKNIFDQSRTGRRRNDRPRAPRVERLILQGIAAGLGDAEAIFGGSSSSDRMLKVGDHLSGFKLSQITPDAVKLTDGTNTFVLDMEKRRSLRRTDDGPWEGSMETTAAPAVSTNAPDETASSNAPASDGAHPGETAIERKLRLRREQEEK